MEKKMKKKYVVYWLFEYIDDEGCLQFYDHKEKEYNNMTEARKRAHDIIKMGYNVKIAEE